MQAVVLAGGVGARLRPLTFSIPKPLLPVGERPVIELLLERLRACEVDHVILATGYQSELIRSFCGDGARFGVRVTYVHEQKPLGTAGPLSLLPELLEGDDFLLVNGDILTTFDFRRLVRFRRDRGDDVAVGFTRHVVESSFGVLSLAGADVTGIVEKPSFEQTVSAGIYAIAAEVAGRVLPDRFLTMPELIEELLASGRRVGAYEITDLWMGLESTADFETATRLLAGGDGVGGP